MQDTDQKSSTNSNIDSKAESREDNSDNGRDLLIRYMEEQAENGNFQKIDPNNLSSKEIEIVLDATNNINEFRELMMYYSCCIDEVTTKFNVMNKELSMVQNRNPFESIKSRLKTPVSIFEKLQRKGYPFTIDSIKKNLNDIAGVRVICSFIEDIYMLRDALLSQDDVHLVQEKDYIQHPKENGYRSLHLIIETPIYLTSGKRLVRCEVQLRTIAMDFWASLDHKIKYKQDIPNQDSIEEEMKYSAEMINQLDQRMQQIHRKIQAAKDAPYAKEKN